MTQRAARRHPLWPHALPQTTRSFPPLPRGVSLLPLPHPFRAEAATGSCTGLVLCVALSYGARQDITRAAQELCRRVAEGSLAPEQVGGAACVGWRASGRASLWHGTA